LGQHDRDDCLTCEERRTQINRYHSSELFVRKLAECLANPDTCVVYEDINSAHSLMSGFHHEFGTGFLGKIVHARCHIWGTSIPAYLCRFLQFRFGSVGRKVDRRALRRKPHSYGAPNATRRTSDKRNLSSQITHPPSLPTRNIAYSLRTS
jgi:hypothetical protein